MSVNVNVLDIQPTTLDMITEVTITPHGTYRDSTGAPSQELVLSLSGASTSTITFGAGTVPDVVNTALGMEGDPSTYPHDAYRTPVEARLTAAGEAIPVQIMLSDQTHDWDTQAHLTTNTRAATSANVAVSRAAAATGILFQLAIMACLAAIVTIATLRTITSSEPVEFSLLGWFAALLFALPAIRNTLPGTPGVGTDADYFVYFWALLLVAICTITVAAVWIKQKFPPTPKTATESQQEDHPRTGTPRP